MLRPRISARPGSPLPDADEETLRPGKTIRISGRKDAERGYHGPTGRAKLRGKENENLG